jgi:uncharacterized protein (DUF305 family)
VLCAVALMVPHHQAAIEMAQSELRYGHDEQFRRNHTPDTQHEH